MKHVPVLKKLFGTWDLYSKVNHTRQLLLVRSGFCVGCQCSLPCSMAASHYGNGTYILHNMANLHICLELENFDLIWRRVSQKHHPKDPFASILDLSKT